MGFNPSNHSQDIDAVTACSCSFCGAKPMELCKTKSGYIAQFEHGDRSKEWAKRAGKLPCDRKDYSVVTPSKARIITIEVIVPTEIDRTSIEIINHSLERMTTSEGDFAAVVSDKHIEQDMEDAKAILKSREVTTWME